SDRMTYITAEEANDYGLIDRVLSIRKQLPLPEPVAAGRG
ncbi:MAG: ATP-dependent Clp protease proteolytic subunit, partial [Cyanobacteriota bacterium]